MATLFIRHQVADYTAWRTVYDAFAGVQKRLGVQAEAVYQAVDDPNNLTVTHDFATIEAAKAFTESPELHEALGSAGVQGQPAIWIANRT